MTDQQEVEGEETVETGPAKEVLEEAHSMGWKPQEEFDGDPEKWVGAEEFVERGRTIMPILLANNKRLQKDLLTRDHKIDNLTGKIRTLEDSIGALEKHYTEANKRAVENAKEQLKIELRDARDTGDLDTELEIQDKLDEIRDSERKPPESKKEEAQGREEDFNPAFVAWQTENPWFGKDVKKTKAIVRIAEDLRDEGNELEGADFFNECLKVLESKATPKSGKVEGTGHRPSVSTEKTFASLPKEAKEACWDDTETLVGPDKRYKTKKEWESAYAKIYYGE